ncbi:MAG: FecR domain-containing protein [Holophaga sp.]|nr:FecR domain-containing protein [Holophaga sp.]
MNTRLFDLNRTSIALLLAPVAILTTAQAQVPAQSALEQDDYMGESPERYAQVKVVEGDVRITKGDLEESLTRGIPIAEGDVVESRGRGVLQLGDGTRIAFAGATRFQVAALFTDRKGERQVLLRLDYGRIRIAMGSQSDARIRIDTTSGTVSLADGTSISCEMDRDHSLQVRVLRGRAHFSNAVDRTTLTAGNRLTVYGNQDRLDRIRSFNTYDSDSFDDWCSDQFRTRRSARGNQYIPREINAFADDLDDNGDWIYVDETSSWCWQPRGLSAEWRPYWQGRWGAYGGGMTWIADEPWGYVTHHHGRWGWGARHGWYWIPGIYYSPAWVAWNTFDTFFGWAPMGYWNAPCTWGYGGWGGGHCWNIVNYSHVGQHRLNRHIYSDVNVLRTFNRGTGASSWTGTGMSGRPLAAPWQRGPLVVTRAELSNPTQLQRVVAQRPLMRERVQTYDRQAQAATGRSIQRREIPTQGRPETPSGGRPLPMPFEDRTRTTPGRSVIRESRPIPPDTSTPREVPNRPDRPLPRETTPTGERGGQPRETERPTPRERVREEMHRPTERPEPSRERPREEQPRQIEQPAPPRERVREERPREVERPAPRETPREIRQERPAPRETPREMPRETRQERPYSPPPSAPPPSQSRPVERPRGR